MVEEAYALAPASKAQRAAEATRATLATLAELEPLRRPERDYERECAQSAINKAAQEQVVGRPLEAGDIVADEAIGSLASILEKSALHL